MLCAFRVKCDRYSYRPDRASSAGSAYLAFQSPCTTARGVARCQVHELGDPGQPARLAATDDGGGAAGAYPSGTPLHEAKRCDLHVRHPARYPPICPCSLIGQVAACEVPEWVLCAHREVAIAVGRAGWLPDSEADQAAADRLAVTGSAVRPARPTVPGSCGPLPTCRCRRHAKMLARDDRHGVQWDSQGLSTFPADKVTVKDG